MVFEHEIRQFTTDTLSATQEHWRGQCESSEDFTGIYQSVFDWAEEHIHYDNSNEEFAYGIFNDGSSPADAIVRVIYSSVGKRWVKMLNMDVSPKLDTSFTTEIPYDDLASIYTATIIGVVRITQTHPTSVVKLYGRSNILLSFLTGFASYFNEAYSNKENIRVGIKGRWLVIEEFEA